MKTLFICSTSNIEYHVGEEYDHIVEVEDQPTTTTIYEFHNRIRNRVRKMWIEDATPEGTTREEGDEQGVHVWLDAASPFNAMLIDLRIVMKAEENIIMELPYLGEDGDKTTTTDPETLALLDKLDKQGGNHA